MAKNRYFDGVTKVSHDDFHNEYWCSWFFAECSRLAYATRLRAGKEFRRIGFTTYNFYSVEGAQVHIAKNSDKIITYEEALKKVNNNPIYKLINILSKYALRIKRIGLKKDSGWKIKKI